MSAPINDGGPAFPTDPDTYNGTGLCGMTLRDYFAGQRAQLLYRMADAMIAARKETEA